MADKDRIKKQIEETKRYSAITKILHNVFEKSDVRDLIAQLLDAAVSPEFMDEQKRKAQELMKKYRKEEEENPQNAAYISNEWAIKNYEGKIAKTKEVIGVYRKKNTGITLLKEMEWSEYVLYKESDKDAEISFIGTEEESLQIEKDFGLEIN